MPSSYPAAWLWLALPFVSTLVLRSVPWLWRPAANHNRLMQAIGVLGLAGMAAGLTGLAPAPYALPLTLVGGAVSGYAIFSVPRHGRSDDGGGGDSDGPPDEPTEPPGVDERIDWRRFDRLRAEWEHEAQPTSRALPRAADPRAAD
jgi:hypothetical protein